MAVYLSLLIKNKRVRFFIELAYNGKIFHGWQKQPNAVTIQETVETCFQKIFQEPIKIVGAGRTDTGVHARQFIAHFDVGKSFHKTDLMYKLNRMLPYSIVIKDIYQVNKDAHARFDALSRTYTYHISRMKDPFQHDFSSRVYHELDVSKMNAACDILKKHTDFQCFSKVKTDVWTYNCKIEEAFWIAKENQLVFTIKADRFLRNMVRAIVGTLLEIGCGKKSVKNLYAVLESKNRGQAGKSVKAKGLFLTAIEYPKSIYL